MGIRMASELPHRYCKTCGCKRCDSGRASMARMQLLKQEVESLRGQLNTAVTRQLVAGKIHGVRAQQLYNMITYAKSKEIRELAETLGIVPIVYGSRYVPAEPVGIRLVRYE